ncbi:MAG: hypothetical protein AAF740_11575 [Bacteroidota bacterium]
MHIITTALIFLIPFISLSQTNTFRVIVSEGMPAGFEIGKEVTVDTIEIPESGYLGLVNQSEQLLELTKAGVYEVSALENRLSDLENTSIEPYLNFILDESDPQKVDTINFAERYPHLRLTGSASHPISRNRNRAIVQFQPLRYPSNLIPLKRMNNSYIGDFVALRWTVNKEVRDFDLNRLSGEYKVTIASFAEKEIVSFETKDTTFLIDRNNERVTKEMYLVRVSDAEDESIHTGFTPIKPMSEKYAKQPLKAFEKIPKENTALAALVRAKFFEQQGLLGDAMAAYTQAALLAPEVATYQNMLNAFLKRARMDRIR